MGNAFRKAFHKQSSCSWSFSLYIGVAFPKKKSVKGGQLMRTNVENMESLSFPHVEQGALYSFKLEEIAAQGPLFSDDEEYIPDPELQ